MKLAIFGGSFDPPHIGHKNIITSALNHLDIDKLVIMPTFLNPFKSEVFAPATKRLEWLEMMCQDLDKVEVSSFEINQNEPSFTINTIKHFEKSAEKVYFIIGADNLYYLEKWHKFDEIDKKVQWVVATRDNIEIPSQYIKLFVDVTISSSELRSELIEKYIDKNIANSVQAYYKET